MVTESVWVLEVVLVSGVRLLITDPGMVQAA
jgi:hypothetical protein